MKLKDLIRFPGRVRLPQIDEIKVDEPKKAGQPVPGHLIAFDMVHNPGLSFFENHQTVHIKLYYFNEPPRGVLEKALKNRGFPLGERLKLLKITVIN